MKKEITKREVVLSTSGAIVLIPSDVFFTNQTGGYSCHHPYAEGVFIPLSRDEHGITNIEENLHQYFAGENSKYKGYCNNGIDKEDAEFLDKLFEERRLPFKVDQTKLKKSEEGWIYITIIADADPGIVFLGFKGAKAIFVFPNSD